MFQEFNKGDILKAKYEVCRPYTDPCVSYESFIKTDEFFKVLKVEYITINETKGYYKVDSSGVELPEDVAEVYVELTLINKNSTIFKIKLYTYHYKNLFEKLPKGKLTEKLYLD